VIVADADAHCARAKAAGAVIIDELETKNYVAKATVAATPMVICGGSAATIRGRVSQNAPDP